VTELELNRDQYLELEKLALGAFRPLSGFMDEDQFRTVVETMRLPDGAVFPLPVVLDLSPEQARAARGRRRVTLVHAGCEVGEIAPESFYGCDKLGTARKLFGTDDVAHPGVAHFLRLGEVFVGGPVRLTQRVELDISPFELTPERTRRLFAERGWTRVVGFQTRNVPHRAHEYLQRVALEHADGLFVQPLVGRKKVGDYTPDAIIAGYRAMIERFLPSERVVFGILSTAMRYAGPREALFHAIIRRNYGCTHFIIGRDHAGVGGYYGKYDAHELTRRFEGELGIEIMRFCGPHYCAVCGGIATEKTCPHAATAPEAVSDISGTDIRAALTNGGAPNASLIRPEIVAALRDVDLFVRADEA